MNISTLIGAGFSANQGYPTGIKLNELLFNCTGDEFAFSPAGGMMVSDDGKKPFIGYKTSYDVEFDFCKELFQFFNSKYGYFDYEEFCDFIHGAALKDPGVEKLAAKYVNNITGSTSNLIYSLDNILNQLLGYYLKDSAGKSFYDDQPYITTTYYPGYTGIMSCIKELSENFIIHNHTLNHDLFFERFDNTDVFAGKLCDGFEELGSPYYGQLNIEGRIYKCRVPHYTGIYDGNIRLYKLHGSRDYAVYHGSEGAGKVPENYVKTRWGVGFSDFFKEKIIDGKLQYENDWVNYHADFLTGTSSKIKRYQEPLLYKKLFDLFYLNLRNSEKLIIIGYGAKDSEINKIILENFDYKNNPSFIIDPYPGEKVFDLHIKLNAKLIVKNLNDIEMTDLM